MISNKCSILIGQFSSTSMKLVLKSFITVSSFACLKTNVWITRLNALALESEGRGYSLKVI